MSADIGRHAYEPHPANPARCAVCYCPRAHSVHTATRPACRKTRPHLSHGSCPGAGDLPRQLQL
jgi:hypothetical protein